MIALLAFQSARYNAPVYHSSLEPNVCDPLCQGVFRGPYAPPILGTTSHTRLGQYQKLLEIPPGEWVHFDIVAKLGRQSTGTWNLSITVPGQDPAVFKDLPNGHPQWQKLDWLGFSSNATEERVYYLDNIELTGSEVE